MRTCRGCGEDRTLREFGPAGNAKRCNVCMKLYARAKAARIKRELAGDLPTKTCWRCKRSLPIEEFAWKEPCSGGRISQCSTCCDPDGAKRCARCGEMKPKADFYPKEGRLNSYCKPCSSEYGRIATLRRYGLTPAEYESIAKDQEGCCAICGKWTEVLWVDHDHSCCPEDKSCGRCRRGLLCMHCNGALGMLQDDVKILKVAIDYLEFYRTAGTLANLGVLRP